MENKKPLIISEHYSPDSTVTLFKGDRLELIKEIKLANSKAELIVTSPPYNTGKEYEQKTSMKEYVESQEKTIESCLNVLSETGSICWQVGHYIEGSAKNKEAFPLDLVLYPIFKKYGLKLRNRIVWYFGHGLHETFRFSGRHETILWFTRDTDKFTFNLDPVRIPQKYPGKRSFRGSNIGKLSGNRLGKNPTDIWDMPNVKSNHVEKTSHPCQFPVALVARLVLALTNEGDLVLDPYIGVGTTAVASVLYNRKSAGADLETKYLEIAKDRITQAYKGVLKYRPIDQPVYQPDGKSSVSRIPDEWKDS